jgi:phosphatidylserine decarboxylase
MSSFLRSDEPGQSGFPLAKAGYPFIFASVFATLVFAILGLVTLSLIGLMATFFICYFFRDPDRVIPNEEGCIVSPADGKIISAGLVNNSRFFEGSCMKISIFMSIFNVHVNRIPYEGKINKIQYHPGKFFSANLDKASTNNEHNAVFIETEKGMNICTVQVAGLIARRIICKVQKDDIVDRGQRLGLICFGSRVDVYLPAEMRLKVAVGDKVKAGTSVLGDL